MLHGEFIKLENSNGCCAYFTEYGARWVAMYVPDRNGKLEDVVLGFDTVDDYQKAVEQYHGAVVGRVCGRIGNATFLLNGKTYHLASNDVYGQPVKNHLHGGVEGFHKKIWSSELVINEKKEKGVQFTYVSCDGEEGYPGEIRIAVTYFLTEDNSVDMFFEGKSDRDTLLNITNHTFFNLNGNFATNVLNHVLKLKECTLIECDKELLPTGNLIDVSKDSIRFDGSMNVLDSTLSSEVLNVSQPDISLAYAFPSVGKEQVLVAEIAEAESGRRLSIYSDLPSLQVYDAYFMDGSDIGKNNIPLSKYAGIALEPQGFPDAPNHPNFPSIKISPDKPLLGRIKYVFDVIK